jgi:hypothetical protein
MGKDPDSTSANLVSAINIFKVQQDPDSTLAKWQFG